MLCFTDNFSDDTDSSWKKYFCQLHELYLVFCLLQLLDILFCMLVWKEIKQNPEDKLLCIVCVASICLVSFDILSDSLDVDSGCVMLCQVSGYPHSFEMSRDLSPNNTIWCPRIPEIIAAPAHLTLSFLRHFCTWISTAPSAFKCISREESCVSL